ncbi:hypothetical protein [Pedobacter immunditicola]|uniref:hypothetical protein n=1 Tax=Pedobacter immunditicola TaxID=3133440 RepID=UPI003094CC63
MKTSLKLYSLILFVAFIFNACRNPAYEMNVLFDANVIEYKATLVLKDANGKALPNNLNVAIGGTDAKSIYDFSGTKQVFAPGGVITLGVTPKDVPTAAKTLNFNVIITGQGYDDKNIPVSIALDQKSQIVNVTMLEVSKPSPVTAIASRNSPLVSGTTSTATTLSTPSVGTVAETATVTVPAGVQMRNAAGAAITGSSVKIDMINYEAKDPATNELFPGASLSAPNVVGADGVTGSAFFIPAGFTSIKMFVNNNEVRNFSAPISVNVEVDPNFKPSATGANVKAGDKLPVYSYDVNTGQFKYETLGTVALNTRGKLSVTFPTNHLTVFVVGDAFDTKNCVSPQFTFLAPWLNDATLPVVIEVFRTSDNRKIVTKTVEVANGIAGYFKGLPKIGVTYKISHYNGDQLSTGTIADPCAGQEFTIDLKQPTTPVDQITLELNVTCPGTGKIVVPNFDLFFKPAGAPDTEYKFLGTAIEGKIITTLLKVGSTYDFRAGWKNETKVVNNRTIDKLDMSVGVGEGEFLGTKSPEHNRALLIEACKLIN